MRKADRPFLDDPLFWCIWHESDRADYSTAIPADPHPPIIMLIRIADLLFIAGYYTINSQPVRNKTVRSREKRAYRDFYARKRDLSASPRFLIYCFICAGRLDLRCARPRISQLPTLFPRCVFLDRINRIYKILAVCKCFWRFHNPDNPVNPVQKKFLVFKEFSGTSRCGF